MKTFNRVLAIINVFAVPYIGYLIYGYMWQDDIAITLFVFILLFRLWIDETIEAITGLRAVTEFE